MKVAIAGFAAEGRVNYEYWSKQGADITIVDERTHLDDLPAGVDTILGEGAFEKLYDFDLVVRTASLNPARIFTHGKIWSATNEFFEKCPAPIIGVTGTKGKGTTCSLVAKILEADGKKVHLLGNIGVPALSELSKIKQDDIVVFELSSFQLWDLEKSPETAIVLMIEPDHLDIHASMEEYVNAKANIAVNQEKSDLLVHHPTNEYSKAIAKQSIAEKKAYMTDEGAEVVGGKVVIEGSYICSAAEVGLLGAHNLENICAAITAAWRYTQNIQAIRKAIKEFHGLPHRLEFVREVDGVRYFNDSQATGVNSCLAALRTFSQPTVLILGGSDKGLDITKVIDELNPERHRVVLVGESSDKIEAALKERLFDSYVKLGVNTDMEEIVKTATDLAAKDGVVLLSPAHASFDMFENYQRRGELFKQTVNGL